jgi:hypothetical protein
MISEILLATTLFVGGHADLKSDVRERAIQLVQQLGDSSFKVRDKATAELDRLGSAAIDALRDGVKNPDPEISDRCRKLLPKALDLRFQEQIDVLLAKPDATVPMDLPGIKRWVDIAGSNKQSKQLYAKLAKEHRGILLEIESEPGDANQRFLTFCRELYEQVIRPVPAPEQRHVVTDTEILLFLFLGTDSRCIKPNAKAAALANPYATIFLDSSRITELLTGKESSDAVKKLFLAWLEQERYGLLVRRGFMLAAEANLKEAVPLAFKIAANSDLPPASRAYPMIGVVKMLRREHIKGMEPLLRDKTVVGRVRVDAEIVPVELRDVALALSIYASGQRPVDYGFDRFQPNPNIVASSYLHFPISETKREGAHTKWKEWVATQMK